MLEYGFYNMDCMEGMKQLPDGFIDLAIVDPPYGIGADNFKNASGWKGRVESASVRAKNRLNMGGGKLKNRVLNNSNCSWDSEKPSKEYFEELFRVSKHQIIWGGEITSIFHLPGALLYGISANRGKTFRRLKWRGATTTLRQAFSE